MFAKTKFSFCYRIAEHNFVALTYGGVTMLRKSTLYFLDIVKDLSFLSRLSEANDAYGSRDELYKNRSSGKTDSQ